MVRMAMSIVYNWRVNEKGDELFYVARVGDECFVPPMIFDDTKKVVVRINIFERGKTAEIIFSDNNTLIVRNINLINERIV